MTEKQPYKPDWLPRIEAMRDYEVVSVLKTEAKTDTIGRYVRNLPRRYRIKEHDDYTLVGCRDWPNVRAKRRGGSYKPKAVHVDPGPSYSDMDTAQWDAGVRQVDAYDAYTDSSSPAGGHKETDAEREARWEREFAELPR